MKKLALCLLGIHLAAVPCLADVIPTRHDEKKPEAREAVVERLREMGQAPSTAEDCVARMMPSEVDYFAADTARIQSAGGLYWYEWLFGAITLGTTLGIAIWLQQEYVDREHPPGY
jgi:hypothetical protein